MIFLPMIPESQLTEMLAEDVARGDLTTHLLGIGPAPGLMTFAARDPMVVACCEEAEKILLQTGCTVERTAASGDLLKPGDPILNASGAAAQLHQGWKVAQTLIEIASGIATSARAIVDTAKNVRPDVTVVCTRKNVPGTRAMSLKAIMAGGAGAHRLGLSETILVFDAHRQFMTDADPSQIVRRLKTGCPEKKVMIEVSTIDEGLAWAQAGADVIQTDKLAPKPIAILIETLRRTALRPIVSAAGGINEFNVAEYVRAGADVIVTSAPYTAKPLDVQVHIVKQNSARA